MKKNEFIKALKKSLKPLPKLEIKKTVTYYCEMIDDNMENGMSEESAVAKCGSIELIAAEILDGDPINYDKKHKKSAINISLLVLGSPLWIAMIIVFAAVLLSLYIVIWAIIIAFYAVLLALAVGAVAGIVEMIMLISINSYTAFMFLGAGFICGALAIALFIPITTGSKQLAKLTSKYWTLAWKKLLKRGGK